MSGFLEGIDCGQTVLFLDRLDESPRKRANNSPTQTPALLKVLLFTATGAAMTPSSTKKGTRQ